MKLSNASYGLLIGLLLASASFAQDDRWGRTAVDGSGLQLGDATTVTWGFVLDGNGINPAISGESSDDSSLISFLDTNIGAGAGGTDLTNRPWFSLFDDIFDRWDSVSGLQFQYESNDNGVAIGGGFNPGVVGTVADVRIGGHSIDGQAGSNTLAYNYFPDTGDMVIDTDNVDFYSNSADNFLGLRNVLAHEFGHGMGIDHHESNNSRQLMEPFVNLTFDGPQIDDIIEAQRRYGDQLEENGGNDSIATATDLGTFVEGTPIAIGSDGNQGTTVVEVTPDQVDFVSIDDDSDEDFFEFTITGDFDMTFTLDMVGPTYNRGPQDGTQSSYDLASQSDLDLEILLADGTVLGSSNTTGLDQTETLDMFLSAGTYYARIMGRNNDAQFYEFTFLGTGVAVPEPSSLMILGLMGTLCMRRRRRSTLDVG